MALPRALDHIVWPTRNLDALAEVFRRLGFIVGRRNRHPWGTVNHIVQFDGMFLELLGFAPDYEPVGVDEPAFPFAGFCARYLEEHESGAAMLVLRSDDAVEDARDLARRHLGHGRLLPFSRAAQGPDGRDRTVAFTVAFAELPGLLEIGAFLCEQHRPENFWNPIVQQHPNGVAGIAGIVIQSPEPDPHARVLRLFANDEKTTTAPSVELAGGGRIELSQAPKCHRPKIASVNLWANDFQAMERLFAPAGVDVRIAEGAIIVAAPELGATTLAFWGNADGA